MPSLLGNNWQLKSTETGINLIETLLINRGVIGKFEQQFFLNPDLKTGLHDPFLMKDMDKVVDRIHRAIKNQEKIIIFGDYDVDGVTGTTILVDTLKKLSAKVSYRLPHRVEDGYGLNARFIEEFIKLGINLVITVDCGVACHKEISLAKDNNLDIIVTDHHSIPPEFPVKSYAVLHPKQTDCPYPFKDLTGAGVAFKLAQALFMKLSPEDLDAKVNRLLDVASLGTVADCAPLQGENRVLVKYGLKVLKNTGWPGLELLKKKAGLADNIDLSTESIGYYLAPRLNAAGRIDTAYFALQLLLSDSDKIVQFADKLEKLNQKRQQLTTKALEQIELEFTNLEESAAIIAHHPQWHIGIVGLIAGKLAEKYSRPSFIMEQRGDHFFGSARSRDGFSVVEALRAQAEYLEHFGGHQQAAGFTLKKANLEAFTESLKKFTAERIDVTNIKSSLTIDCEINASALTLKTYEQIRHLAPFGIQNTVPCFLLKNVAVRYLKTVGATGKHLKFQAALPDRNIETIGFGLGELSNSLKENQTVDLVVELDQNTWNNDTKVQLKVKDISV